MNQFPPLLMSLGFMLLGSALTYTVMTFKISDERAVFLVGSASITNRELLPEYRKVAEPLARKGGYEVIAAANMDSPQGVLLEGEWPGQGLFFIERYDSMEKLQEFVNSKEFNQAKILRDKVAKVHFMFALEQGENLAH